MLFQSSDTSTMKRPRKTTEPESAEDQKYGIDQHQLQHHHQQEATDTVFIGALDICQQLLDRYGKSAAPQHRHLCATAAATRSIIQSESLPLTPFSYFAAAIATVADDASRTLDSDALSALASFLAIVLPLVPSGAIAPAKAADAVSVLVGLMEQRGESVSTASSRAVVKCLGVLLGFCDLEDWDSVKLGFETLLKFSIDKRPKVRKCAQDCVVHVFKSLKLPTVIKEASKLILSLLKGYMPLALEISALEAQGETGDEIMPKPMHLEVIHMLVLLKLIVPYLSVKVRSKVLSHLHKLINSHFSALTRHIFSVTDVILETSKVEVATLEAENIIKSLLSYVSLVEKNPGDTILSAATLLKSSFNKLQLGEGKWISSLPLVFGSIAGLLTAEASIAPQAAAILKELIDWTISKEIIDNEVADSMELTAVKSVCSVFENVLNSSAEIPNKHIFAVISVLFCKLGDNSFLYTKAIIFKLADMMTLACENQSDTKHLQECLGTAVIAMGPEKMLSLLPIKFDAKSLSCSNAWLIPILRDYVVGSSLGFFMEHVVPLAESFQQVSAKAKKSMIHEDLQAYAHGCWGLLPAFCRQPTDTYRNFGSLAKLLIAFLTNDSFMLENVAIALQELVNQNHTVLRSNEHAGEFATLSKISRINDSAIEFRSKHPYSKKIASRNIKALASCSMELLQALMNVFFEAPPSKREYLKDAITCLSSISDSSVIKSVFTSSLERLQLINDLAELGNRGSHTASVDQEEGSLTFGEKNVRRCQALELASSFLEGASEDLISLIYNLIKQTLQESDEVGQSEAYHTLSRILGEHSWFCSSHGNEVMDFLLGLKPPVNITSLRGRFACFQILLVHAIKERLDEENSKAFLVLNEIILTIKDSTEKARKAAYDMLLSINSSLQRSSSATSDEHYQNLINMIMGYLSGSSPHIKSGAVSALSVLIYDNADICTLAPDLVPSILELLQTKAVEVIKAVLGFVKVLVSCLHVEHLENFLPDIINGVLPWSSVSRHHFRTKVTVILEIMLRKCGSAAVELLVPEKHKNFVKSVLKNRHGKASTKEVGGTDIESKVSETTPWRMKRKRKNEESSNPSREDGKIEPRLRKREKKHEGFIPRQNEPHIFAGYNNDAKITKESQSRGNTRSKRRKFTKDPATRKNTQQKLTKASKKVGVVSHGTVSKLAKRKKKKT